MVQDSLKSYLQFFQPCLKINGQRSTQHVFQFDPDLLLIYLIVINFFFHLYKRT